MFPIKGEAYFRLFSLLRPQLEGVVGRSGRAVLLHLAAGHDPAHRLQFRHHYFEVKMLTKWCKKNNNRHNIPKNKSLLTVSFLPSRFVRTCFTTIALSYLPVWLTLDYLSDLMYMTDMIITVHTGALTPPAGSIFPGKGSG